MSDFCKIKSQLKKENVLYLKERIRSLESSLAAAQAENERQNKVIIELEETGLAMQRRAETAESDWQSEKARAEAAESSLVSAEGQISMLKQECQDEEKVNRDMQRALTAENKGYRQMTRRVESAEAENESIQRALRVELNVRRDAEAKLENCEYDWMDMKSRAEAAEKKEQEVANAYLTAKTELSHREAGVSRLKAVAGNARQMLRLWQTRELDSHVWDAIRVLDSIVSLTAGGHESDDGRNESSGRSELQSPSGVAANPPAFSCDECGTAEELEEHRRMVENAAKPLAGSRICKKCGWPLVPDDIHHGSETGRCLKPAANPKEAK